MSRAGNQAAGSGGVGQRLLALGVFAVFAVLVWLAYSGRYDAAIGRIAAWLHHPLDAIHGLRR